MLAQRPVAKKPFKRMYEALDCKVLPYRELFYKKEPLLLLWIEETVPDIELLQSVTPLTPFCCYKL